MAPDLSSLFSISGETGNSDYVCSPHSTIMAAIITVIIMFIILIIAFAVFYRYQRRKWLKKGGVAIGTISEPRIRPVSSRVHPNAPPPPLPSRPSTASGALGPTPPVYNSSSSSEVLYKDPSPHPLHQQSISRQRFSGLSASSMTSLPQPR